MASFLLLVCLLAWGSAGLACSEMHCPLAWVLFTQRGDGMCDLACNSASGLDFSSSDCYQYCVSVTSFPQTIENSECQAELDLEVCGWDAGDCGCSGCSGCSGRRQTRVARPASSSAPNQDELSGYTLDGWMGGMATCNNYRAACRSGITSQCFCAPPPTSTG